MSEKIVQLNEEIIKGQIRELVRGSVEETLNELLEKEAESLTQAARYERSEARQGYRSSHYDRNLTTTSGDVTLHMPRLKGVSFETAIIERYRCSVSSWLVAPFCLFAKEKSSRFLCENSCSWWVGYSVVRGLLSVRQTGIYLSKTILAATTGDPSSMICSLPSKRYPHRS